MPATMSRADGRVLAALAIGPAGAHKLTRRTALSTRAVRDSVARLLDLGRIDIIARGPRGGPLFALNPVLVHRRKR